MNWIYLCYRRSAWKIWVRHDARNYRQTDHSTPKSPARRRKSLNAYCVRDCELWGVNVHREQQNEYKRKWIQCSRWGSSDWVILFVNFIRSSNFILHQVALALIHSIEVQIDDTHDRAASITRPRHQKCIHRFVLRISDDLDTPNNLTVFRQDILCSNWRIRREQSAEKAS